MSFDLDKTIISQYTNSPRVIALARVFFDGLNAAGLIDSFFEKVWNVETAQGWGLDFWGKIVGVSRVLKVPLGTPYLGFAQSADAHTFADGPFYAGAALTDNYALSDDAFRILIYAKALSNISDGGMASINKILLSLFPNRGNCHVQDNGDMTMSYVFDFTLTPVEQAIIGQSGILPRPAGISIV